MYFLIEHLDESLDQFQAHTRETFCQDIRAEKEDGPAFFFRVHFADPSTVAADQIDLKLGELTLIDGNFAEDPKASVDAVDALLSLGSFVDITSCSGDTIASGGGEGNSFFVDDDTLEIVQGERVPVESNHDFLLPASRSALMVAP